MMKKSIKKSCALLIACALTLSAFAVLPKANAANMVDTGKKDCSIDFKTGGDDKVSADLGTTTVDVKLYKVADISEVGITPHPEILHSWMFLHWMHPIVHLQMNG